MSRRVLHKCKQLICQSVSESVNERVKTQFIEADRSFNQPKKIVSRSLGVRKMNSEEDRCTKMNAQYGTGVKNFNVS